MTHYDDVAGLRVAKVLREFVDSELLPDADLSSDEFWRGFADLVHGLSGRNRELLAERDRLQGEIDSWLISERGAHSDIGAQRRFLESIGYLRPAPAPFTVSTTHVDEEVAAVAGPQLVVPVTNARYALNAANARWGSLYDAFYGTNALPGSAKGPGYDPERGALVIERVRGFLDEVFPLSGGTHRDATGYRVVSGRLSVLQLGSGAAELVDSHSFVGHTGSALSPTAVLLRHHGLHVEIRLAPSGRVGASDSAGVDDVQLESALTTIVDFEDSVATVDAEDKVAAYRNWLGLNRGDLTASFDKGGRVVERRLAEDRVYTAADGSELVLPGRSLLFVRNVGHLMTTDAVLDAEGRELGEGVLDAVITTLCALPGRDPGNRLRNGRSGSIYIVKPKMHGPEEVRFTADLFTAVEQLIGLPARTLKVGVMDEERRTSVNLDASLAEVSDRVVFINTGFLDRSGDEIHTAMEAGPVVRKAALRAQKWILAYEDRNVEVGLRAGLPGRGQIGKGMWAMPDLMAEMLEQKVAHPLAGASTAWVPSPTAATLHALHYHRVDVAARQSELGRRGAVDVDRLLALPIGDPSEWSPTDRAAEVDNNVQGLLGYVVRWVELGVGASKVPDIDDVGLMEDRATLRISSQLLANWLRHGVVDEDQVRDSLRRMAAVVDGQNADEPGYQPMCDDLAASPAFAAAEELVFHGRAQPNGYTEPILHRHRRAVKDAARATRRT